MTYPENEKYRTLTLTSSKDGFVISYKETHEGVMCLMDDGTWAPSIMVASLDHIIEQAARETDEGWVVDLT